MGGANGQRRLSKIGDLIVMAIGLWKLWSLHSALESGGI